MATATPKTARIPTWAAATGPLVIIAALVAVFLALNPIATLREVPAVEEVAFERTILREGMIELRVRNDGPDPVTISQVLVDDAYWDFSITNPTMEQLRGATIRIPYPWDSDQPLNIALLTSTGVAIEHEIEVAAVTPRVDAATVGVYALLGVYIGIIPVAIGLLWFPALKRASARWLGFFLAFTAGLLIFLLIDTVQEGIELAGAAAAVLNGVGLFAIGALMAVAALVYFEGFLHRRKSGAGATGGLVLAYLIATGIGLHNMGEGLAVGAALAAGNIGLGTFLVLGFMIHNTTEGLAIVSPLGGEARRPSLWHFAALGAIAGAPTVAGAWLGGFAFSPAWGALAFGVAAGAIAQVVWAIYRGAGEHAGLRAAPGALGFAAGLSVMYLTGLLAAT